MRPTTRHPLLLASAIAIGIAGITLGSSAIAQSAPPGPRVDGTLLSVSASAQATRVPDVATVSTGVVTEAPDANTALRQNAEQMAKVVAAIKAAGIAERDIRTSGISINPQSRYSEGKPPVITGYQASNTVSLKIRDVAKVGKVLDALVAQGANQLNGPSFEVDKPDEAYDEARRAALAKAQARAKMYADSVGMRVARIVSISEGGSFAPPRPVMMMSARAQAAPMQDTSVSPGETELSANLDVVFELAR